ncbi:hypothetical protein [Lacticaseibacillus brantae]|uniref:Uncharacterized protein n=1 Tax=Lacticaseibacillus brantae DSM 23927 TaxID=1423727 RepID=A0A0R2B0Y2_9LACO|nr:hypothetical protein [Lacticaseibacillus brantae]KRM72999.1 hypothetical protein FC34_GL000718 [Lacticaseibacillus brantae DSM 23927]
MKTIYETYNSPQPDGNFYYVHNVSDTRPTAHPYTEIPIPDSLKNGLPKFDWMKNQWVDASEDAQAKMLSDLQAAKTKLTADLKIEQDARIEAEAENNTIKQAVASIGLKVAELSVPNTKPAEVAE